MRSYLQVAMLGCTGEHVDSDLSMKWKSYAEMCRVQLSDQNSKQNFTSNTSNSTVGELGRSKTAVSPQTTVKEDDYEAFADVLQLNPSDPTSSDEEHKATSTGGSKGGLYIMKGLSHFIRAAKASKNKDVSEDSSQNQPPERTLSAADDSKDMDSNNTNTNNNVGAAIEDDDQLEKSTLEDTITVQKQSVTAKNPKFEGRLIPLTDERNKTRYSNIVYPWRAKMLTALGVEPSKHASTSSEDRKILCNSALEYLLKQTEDCRAKYASEFEGLIVTQLNCKFKAMKLLLDSELHTTYNELHTTSDECQFRRQSY